MSNETKNDGGPAFPTSPSGDSYTDETGYTRHQYWAQPGMALRDWFAGQALAQLIPLAAKGDLIDEELGREAVMADIVASQAYCIADAMLKAREQ